MTSSLAPTPRPSAQAGLAVALTAAADYLLFGQPLGFSLLLFAALLAGGIATANAGSNEVSEWKYVLIPLALAPLYEAVSVLSVSIAALFLIAFALAASGQLRRGLASFAQQAAAFVLTIPVRLPMDFIRARLLRQRLGQGSTGFGWVAKWVMPLVLAMVFVGLFSIANPIVEHWLSLIDLRALLDLVEPERVVFWLLVVLVVWAFLRPRLPRIRKLSLGELSPGMAKVPPAIDAKAVVTVGDLIFSKAAILRALIVFNAMFAVQTVLDAAYLWGGVALPDGMTYANYAHRGAYPLIVTALLAAAFVLVAMRPGSATSGIR